MIETTFTPLQSLFGGALIGAAAVLLMGLMGRIMGATGILGGLVRPDGWSDWSWRAVFLAGMVSAPLLMLAVTGDFPTIEVPVSTPMMIVGGLLVGIGATFGGGCTSGHGVCGLARFSARSVVATLTFMAATAVTVYIVRHGIGA